MPNKKRLVSRGKVVERYLGEKRNKKSPEIMVSLATTDSVLGQQEVVLEHKTEEGKFTPAFE